MIKIIPAADAGQRLARRGRGRFRHWYMSQRSSYYGLLATAKKDKKVFFIPEIIFIFGP
jgi:hypothetical protein